MNQNVFLVVFLAAGWLGLPFTRSEGNSELPPAGSKTAEKVAKLREDGEFLNSLALIEHSLFGAQPTEAPTMNPDWITAENIQHLSSILRSYQDSLANLNRSTETDAFLEKFITVYGSDWRALQCAAVMYQRMPHSGRVVAGKFYRGNQQRNGEYASVEDRDRARALQLMVQAMPLAQKDSDTLAAGWFFLDFAKFFLDGRNGSTTSWELQDLTDFETLPEADTENPYGYGYSMDARTRGVPMVEDGKPLTFALPASFEAAKNDGERWRWTLEQAVTLNVGKSIPVSDKTDAAQFSLEDAFRAEVRYRIAQFYQKQLGEQTIQNIWNRFNSESAERAEETEKREGSLLALDTLTDDETIAQTATGIQRFTMPEEANYIRIYQEMAKTPGRLQRAAVYHLALIAENRRQYSLAVEYYQQLYTMKRVPVPEAFMDNPYVAIPNVKEAIEKITGNWGWFTVQKEQTSVNPKLAFSFRNAKKATFTATRFDLEKVIATIRTNLDKAASRGKFDRRELSFERDEILGLFQTNFGYRLVNEDGKNQEKKYTPYLTGEKTTWEETLTPAEGFRDKTVTVPLKVSGPGAYLVEMQLENGNRVYTLAWVTDTVLVQKKLDKAQWYYVADARTGKAIPGATLHFTGYREEVYWDDDRRRNKDMARIFQKDFTATSDENGTWIATQETCSSNYRYLITVHTPDGKEYLPSSRISAFWLFGDSEVYYRNNDSNLYMKNVGYGITDRPIYRPEQKVFYKFWIGQATYGDGDYFMGTDPEYLKAQVLSDAEYRLIIENPNGDEIENKIVKTDAYGAISGELQLEKDAKLGQYRIAIKDVDDHYDVAGYVTFRTEEYRKPEFEVTVDAPKKPVALGDKAQVGIQARYYFGAPVANGTVKYRIFRESYTQRWYAPALWDWLYGSGYWWHLNDYAWYPGWGSWGYGAPERDWYSSSYFSDDEEELVFEGEIQLTPEMEGKAEVTVDTSLAATLYSDRDHQYRIVAEVEDASRRMISGEGTIIAARKPFRVNVWARRGYLTVGDQIPVSFAAKMLDGKPVTGTGTARVLEVTYDKMGKPQEKELQSFEIHTDEDGRGTFNLKADHAGQFRISCTITSGGDSEADEHADAKTIEGAMILTVHGDGFTGENLKFNDLELIPDKESYQPGDTVKLMINTDLPDATVVLFARCDGDSCSHPQYIHMTGKSQIVELPVRECDQPNFFIEGLVTSGSKIYSVVKEVCVPPEKQVLNMEVIPSSTRYMPGEEAEVTVKLTDLDGKPFTGETVLTVYDKSLDAVAGGTNVCDIYDHFWSWKRDYDADMHTTEHGSTGNYIKSGDHYPAQLDGFYDAYFLCDVTSPLSQSFQNMVLLGKARMSKMRTRMLRADATVEDGAPAPMMSMARGERVANIMQEDEFPIIRHEEMMMEAPRMREVARETLGSDKDDGFAKTGDANGADEVPKLVEATIRKNFADTAFWTASLVTDADGCALVKFPMPENLTTWKLSAWAMGKDLRVGKAETEVITAKNLILRMQTPRFLTTSDELLFTANVHNYLDSEKQVVVTLNLPEEENGNVPCRLVEEKSPKTVTVTVPAQGEARVDWTVRAENEGACLVTMTAQTDVESDAMQLSVPVQIHGMAKQDARSGMIASDAGDAENPATGVMEFTIPDARRPHDSALEIRFSPTLAGAMLDAIPYLVEYPYGCTEQTLNRFLPAVLVHRALADSGVNLSDIANQTNNLNAQEIGSSKERNAQWEKQIHKRKDDPVFNEEILRDMVSVGVDRLLDMQCRDGGWGWFSGYGEHSSPHLTAQVTRGLLLAQQAEIFGEYEGAESVSTAINRGIAWLVRHQKEELTALRLGEELKRLRDAGDLPEDGTLPKRFRDRYLKFCASEMDVMIFATLAQAGQADADTLAMGDYIFRDRVKLSTQSNALAGIAFHQLGNTKRFTTMRNYLTQFLVIDEENQTARLSLPSFCYWWCWYGNDIETQAAYLRMLTLGDTPETLHTASYLVKYLLNNRKNAVYWNSTRDTALVLEAFTQYLRRTNELSPNMTVKVLLDGELRKTVTISPENLFTCDNTFLLEGEAVTGGAHRVELIREGSGPLYYNGYARYFTLEDFIPKTGLEVKVDRKYFRLERVVATQNAATATGQLVKQNVERFNRVPMKVGDTVKSGDLVEVELTIESKNDYTYLMIEDMKPAGFETVDAKSGYNGNALRAYVEYRDNRVVFFVRELNEGLHSVAYRMRAETPGTVSALPTRMEAMYAPELRANSDEMKIRCEDK